MTKAANGSVFPDTSDIFRRKAEGRKALANLTFAEKIAIVEAMRERFAPIRRLREADRLADSDIALPDK